MNNAFIDLKNLGFGNENVCSISQTGGRIINKINGISFLDSARIKEDVFFTTSLGQANIILSEEFKNFVVANNFTNANFVLASKYKWDSMNPTL